MDFVSDGFWPNDCCRSKRLVWASTLKINSRKAPTRMDVLFICVKFGYSLLTLNHHVHDPALHIDYFPDGLSIQMALHVLVGKYSLFYIGLLQIEGQRQVQPGFSVYRDRISKFFFNQVFRVEGGVGGIRQCACGVAQQRPQFFGNVGCVRMQYNTHILQDGALVALQVGQLIHTDHKRRDRRVERKAFDIIFDLFDDLMQRLQFGFAWLAIAHGKTTVCAMKELPEFTEKLINTFDAVGIPWFALFERAEEHFVHAQGIRSILLNNVVWVYHIVFGFRHLLHFVATVVFPIFEDEFSISEIRPELPEFFQVEHIVAYDVHVDMKGYRSVSIFQAMR